MTLSVLVFPWRASDTHRGLVKHWIPFRKLQSPGPLFAICSPILLSMQLSQHSRITLFLLGGSILLNTQSVTTLWRTSWHQSFARVAEMLCRHSAMTDQSGNHKHNLLNQTKLRGGVRRKAVLLWRMCTFFCPCKLLLYTAEDLSPLKELQQGAMLNLNPDKSVCVSTEKAATLWSILL